MMNFSKSITKDEIAALPVEAFQGRIIVIQSLPEAEKAIRFLSGFDLLGFDTETKPNFKKGSSNKVALIQISTEDTCFLFRLNFIGIPGCLVTLLTNNHIKKIGLSLRDDFSALRRRIPLEPEGFLDLQNYVGKFGIEDVSLQKIYAILFKKKISKGQRLTNWEADTLSDAQKKYASLDAWACLKIYNLLRQEERSSYKEQSTVNL